MISILCILCVFSKGTQDAALVNSSEVTEEKDL